MNNKINKPVYNFKNFYWPTVIFFASMTLLGLILLPIYFFFVQKLPSFWIILSTIVYMFFLNFCITAGYHRLFAHRSFQATKWLQAFWLFFGAGAFQMSALKWCTDHRRHHQKVDTNDDPYSITKGAFYAHMGWILLKDSEIFKSNYAPDLLKNPLIMFQHKYYVPIAITSGFVIPTLWGWALGDPIGGFVFIGLVRLFLNHHITFMVNSVCHMWGSQPYSLKHSARDNIVVAFLAVGEGYHNFHHSFEGDYRNGFKWYHWDPTKWAIKSLAWVGQTYKLRKTSHEAILRSKLETQKALLEVKGVNTEPLSQLKVQIDAIIVRINQLKRDYNQLKAQYRVKAEGWEKSSKEKVLQLQAELELAKIELRNRLNQWRRYVDIMSGLPA